MTESNIVEAKNDGRVEVTLNKSIIYQFLSTCFLEPDENTISVLKDNAYRRCVEEASHGYLNSYEMSSEMNVLKSGLKEILKYLDGIGLEEMGKEYGRLFGIHLIAEDCPTCESFYGTVDVFQLTNELADISGFYNAFGLMCSDELKERLDNLGVELEFMHFLSYKEAYALENDGEEKAALCLDGEKKFLKEHLGRWAGHFSSLVEKKTKGGGIYLSLARFLKGFISLEMRYLDVEAEETSKLNMSIFKEKDEAFACDFSAKTVDNKEGIPC